MNKKGFTLVELIAVIILISLKTYKKKFKRRKKNYRLNIIFGY